MKSSAFTALRATLHQAGATSVEATIELNWSSARPSEIVLAIVYDDQPDDPIVWTAARSLFIGAMLESMHGLWVGGGALAVCHTGPVLRIAFKPLRLTRDRWGFAYLASSGVDGFISDTLHLCPPAREAELNLALIDEGLAELGLS